MAPIQWETAHVKAVYEDMVAVLLSTLYRNAERLDGRGGDGGRDIQLRHDDGRLELFELKSFTGRLSKEHGRRRQVESSLKTAAGHNPGSWTLVVPVDHTPDELAWFDGLKRQYPFPLFWRGRTWLDQQMAHHPAIRRYYLENGDSEVVRVLRELRQEQAALAGGIPDIIQRCQVLRQRLDEFSPHYQLDVVIADNSTTVGVRPRYRGAERDHPIMLSFVAVFPNTPTGQDAAERVRRAFDYGDEVVIEPEHFHNLRVDLPGQPTQDLSNGRLILGPAVEDLFSLDARVVLRDSNGVQLGSLPLRFSQRKTGQRGGTLSGQDPTGLLHLAMEADVVDQRGKFNFRLTEPPNDLLPGALLPTLRVLQHLHAPNRLEVQVGTTMVSLSGPLPPGEPVSAAFLALVEELDRVQAFSQTVFPVPRGLSHSDIDVIHRADRLVAGERVAVGVGTMRASVTPTNPQLWEKLMLDHAAVCFSFDEGNYTETIAGVEVPLGPAIVSVSSATIANCAELLATRPWRDDQELVVELLPSPGVQLGVILARGDSPA
jgi:hypothetical protein